MSRLKKGLALVLTLCMMLSLVPVITPSAEAAGTATDNFYRIVHVDAGRKYFSPENIKKIIDNAADAGFNQVELYLSDNQGFRFALDDMNVTTSTGNTYDLTPALGDGYSDGSKYPDGSGKYLTQSEMTDIISYAAGKGIDIVPCINVPGHMGAILEEFTQFKYSGSNSSINLENAEAVAFALAITEKYATYFESQGVKYYNLGADEYANDLSTMGFQGLYTSGKYQKFVDFLNSAAQIVINHKMTPRAFNDGIYYNEDNTYSVNPAIQVCYWSCGWGGYNLASAQYLVNQGMDVINTHGDYYWVLGNTSWQCSADKASQFDYTSFQYRTGTTGNGTISNPAGAMFCIWCDVGNADGTDDGAAVVSATADVIAAFGAALPVSETGGDGGDAGDTGDTGNTDGVTVTENEPITVTAGGTATATISDYNFAGTYTTEDPSIATVEVTGTDATEATTTYTQASVICNTLISSNSDNWKATDYYYKADDGSYYPLYAKRSTESSYGGLRVTYKYTYGYSTDGGSNVSQCGTQEYAIGTISGGQHKNVNIALYTKSEGTGTPASTTVTFTGVAVGTTYVTVGNTRYTIKVTDAPPTGAMTSPTLTIEYWITNSNVYESANTSSASSVVVNSTNATSDEGVDVTTVVPKTAYSNYDGWLELNFWQAMRLDSSNRQTGDSGDDEVADGTAFTHVRYYNNAWQYKTADGVWHYFLSGDQAVAYYMRHTEITTEITTAMKDWGYATANNTPDTSSEKGQVALTVAVVYPDGTVSPAESAMYANSTTIFNYWDGRDIGIIAPLNNSDYTIAKITVTDGKRTDTTTSNIWKPSATIKWNKVTNEAGSEWYDETEVWNDSMGTEPMVNGTASNITWSAKNTAKLVLIYLKPVHYDTNLTVNWVDDSASGALISTMEVAVSSDGTPITFYNGLKQTSALPTEGVGGTFTLDDNAYVTNSSNVNQTFNKNISTVPGVADVYKTGLYQYVSADLSADGKTMTLHYKINNNKLDKTYVLDFGLPVAVPLSDLVDNPEDVKNVTVSGANGSYDAVNKTIVYTPSAVMTGTASVTANVTIGSTTNKFVIGFVPATTVYYEEGFASNLGSFKGTGTQTASEAGKKANYGYDAAYTGETYQSQTGTEPTGTATFAFTGTGVDIYTNNKADTGSLMIKVKQNGTLKKMIAVDTQLKAGTSNSTAVPNQAYNVPVASITGLEYGNYTIELTNVKSGSEGLKDVYIDGFRVYGTLGNQDNDIYKADLEDNPTFIEMRNEVLAGLSVNVNNSKYADQIAGDVLSQVYAANEDKDNIVALVLADNNSYRTADVQDLLDNGPKNEIYLQPGQALVFKVTTPRVVQIGLKALDKATSYTINNGAEKTVTLNSSADMFYKVLDKDSNRGEQTITITNTGSGILSITKLKICDDPNAALGTLTADDLIPALVSLGFKAPEGEEGSSGTDTPTTPPTTDPGAETPTTPADPATGLPFTDVGPSDWFLENVKYVYEKGLMNGTSDTTFSPKKTTNRAMIVTILHRLEGTPAPGAPAPFTDVPAGQYYAEAVAWAAANSIVNGTGDAAFSPLNNITREQMAAILYRYAQYKNYDVSGSADLSTFTDAASISDYAVSALQWAVDAGLINGKGNGILDPKGSATRAEVSAILSRFCEDIAG